MTEQPFKLDHAIIREAVSRALGEDRGPMDITSEVTLDSSVQASGRIVTRQPCIVAGLVVAERVFREVDPSLSVRITAQDSAAIPTGSPLLEIHGSAKSILTGERVALNFLQRLCGIATKTHQFVTAVAGTKVKILDTRKTTPGLRHLEKFAVRCGGGESHRMGLYDKFLFKDNHLQFLGTGPKLRDAIVRARGLAPEAEIEIEADSIDQVRDIVAMDVDWILLDNMSDHQLKECVKIINGRAKTEASGNMTLDRIASAAATGVDYISVGALTHSVHAVDLSLELAV